VKYFFYKRDSKETVEMVRFKVKNKKIIGFIDLINSEFIFIEEFNKLGYPQ
jgi:hypothetical protein